MRNIDKTVAAGIALAAAVLCGTAARAAGSLEGAHREGGKALAAAAAETRGKTLFGLPDRPYHFENGQEAWDAAKKQGRAALETLRKAGRFVWTNLPKAENKGRYGVDHCSPYDDTMVPAPPEATSEVGPHCVSRNPATVVCNNPRIVRQYESELGWVDRVECGSLTPPGGWAGDGQRPAEPQSP